MDERDLRGYEATADSADAISSAIYDLTAEVRRLQKLVDELEIAAEAAN